MVNTQRTWLKDLTHEFLYPPIPKPPSRVAVFLGLVKPWDPGVEYTARERRIAEIERRAYVREVENVERRLLGV